MGEESSKITQTQLKILESPMSKPTMLVEKNITPEKRSLRVMTLAEKMPNAEKIPKKPAPEKKRRVPEEGLKKKQGEIEVKESKNAKRAIEEKRNSDVEETCSNLKQWLSLRQYQGVIRQPCIKKFLKLKMLGWAGQPKCFVMMPTDEELKEPCVAQLYLENPMVVPQAPRKTPVMQPSIKTNSEWREFQKEIR
ncbi:hypothetical protein TIFTF001_015320 [Ficus carica]|uniref:Uncharacterized protein n=1 Tax=Ficus carica TaxID=3494 RepID=A0AA88A7N9_FICCA|nr:hypothetical protein TIFTF001_015320 [Ficus carica]